VDEDGGRVLAADAMTADPVTVTGSGTVAEAAAMMRQRGIRHLPVVEGDRLVGIVAHGDVEIPIGLDREAADGLLARPVAEVMTGDPVVIELEEPVEVAARLMHDHRIGSLPVLDGDRLAGILTASDLFEVLLVLLGVVGPSSRVSVVLPDEPGMLGRAVTAADQAGVRLASLVTEPGPRPGTRRLVLHVATIDPGRLTAALDRAGFPIEGPGRR
jgi:acetoin utilization protein AcuB